MATDWRDVHVFISSTFNDMHGERDYLVKRVFPQLREWCEQRKLRLVDIDLRWGVTEEDATRNRNVVRTCLERIDQCRPFFVCFLGQRRGWVPEHKHVDPKIYNAFPELRRHVGSASVTEMEILHALIEPFHGGNRYVEGKKDEFYQRVEHAFFYLREPSYLADLPGLLRPTYTNALSGDPARDNGELARWRDNVIPAAARQWNRPVRMYDATWTPDAITPELALPLQCPSMDPENQQRWRMQWREAGVSIPEDALEVPRAEMAKAKDFNQQLTSGRLTNFACDTGEALADRLLEDLRRAIEMRYPGREPVGKKDPLQKEVDQQEEFLYLNSEGFIERTGDCDELDHYLEDDSGQMLVLTAPGGMGKSMLLANWLHTRRGETCNADTAFVARFVGQSDGTSTVASLLRLMMLELQQVHNRIPATRMETVKTPDGREEQREVPFEIPHDPTEVHNTWRGLIEHLGDNGKTVIVIDAINQLETGLENLYWLPFTGLPKNVKLIVSLREGAPGSEEWNERWKALPTIRMTRVNAFDDLDDRRKLVEAYLGQFLKELDENHSEALIRSDGAGNPLFLKVVLSELRVLGAFAQLGDVIRTQFGGTPVSAFDAVLRRLESDPAYSAIAPARAVPLIFGLLAHARRGLSAEELTDLLLENADCTRGKTGTGNEDRNGDCTKRAQRDGTVPALDATTLSREAVRDTVYLFLRQVRPFMARRGGLHGFFFESLEHATVERYVKEPETDAPTARPARVWHGRIADHFHAQPDFTHSTIIDRKCHANKRRCEELVWQLIKASDWERLRDLLMSIEFLESKVVAGMTFELPLDFREGLTLIPSDCPERKLIDLLDEAIRRDIHFIARHAGDYPQALFQCCWNSGWWYDCPDAEQHYEKPEGVSKTPPPWAAPGMKFYEHMQRARAQREQRHLAFPWLRSLRPPQMHLGTAHKAVFQGHTGSVNRVTYSPDGARIVSGSDDKTVRIWDAQNGACLNTLQGHTKEICCVAYSPDGTRIVSGSDDKTVRIWDAQNGVCLKVLQGHTNTVMSVTFSPDGARVISGSWVDTLRVWDAHTGTCLNIIEGQSFDFSIVAYSPDGTRIVIGSRDDALRVWDTHTGARLNTLQGHTRNVTSVAYSPDGTRIVTCSYNDKTVRIWDAQNGACLKVIQGDTSSFFSVAYSPDGTRIVSGSDDKTVRVWDAHTGACLKTLQGHTDGITSVAYSPDGTRIVSGSDDKTVRVWDAHTGARMNALQGHTRNVTSVTYSPDGTRIVTGSHDKVFRVWDTHTGACLKAFQGHASSVFSVVYSPDGTRIVSGSWDETVRVWDARGGTCLNTLQGHTGDVWSVAYSPDGTRIISGSDDKTVRVWDAHTGACLNTLQGHTNTVMSVAFSPDGGRIVTGSDDKIVRVWDAHTGACLNILQGHTGDVWSVAYSPDGTRIVSGSWDKTLRVWDAQSGACLEVIQGGGDVTAIAGGANAYPLRALWREKDTIIGDTASGSAVVRFSQEFWRLTTHPSESVWAGTSGGGYLCLIRLERG